MSESDQEETKVLRPSDSSSLSPLKKRGRKKRGKQKSRRSSSRKSKKSVTKESIGNIQALSL